MTTPTLTDGRSGSPLREESGTANRPACRHLPRVRLPFGRYSLCCRCWRAFIPRKRRPKAAS